MLNGGILFRIMNCENGAKQGGVSSPLLFAAHTGGVLNKLQNTGVGCQMVGASLDRWLMLMTLQYYHQIDLD